MRTVDDTSGLLAHHLQTADDHGIFQALSDHLIGQVFPALPQLIHNGQHSKGVHHLMPTGQGDAVLRTVIDKPGTGIVAFQHLQLCLVSHRQRYRQPVTGFAQYSVGLGYQITVSGAPTARLDDAAFLGSDLRDRGAQHIGMLQRNSRNGSTGGRRDDVGAVQQTADAHLKHHELHAAAFKEHERQSSDRFKLGALLILGLHLFQSGQHTFQHIGHQLLVHQLTVYLHPLPEVKDKGRQEQAGFVSGSSQHAFTHGGGASLAVGTGNMDEFHPFFGISQLFHQPFHPEQTLAGAQMDAAVDKLQRLFVGHDLNPEPSGSLPAWQPSRDTFPASPFRH